MMNTIASIDLGSHTARLLIARVEEGCGKFKPLLRRRSYIYLARDFDPVSKQLSKEAVARAITVLGEFSRAITDWRAYPIVAVATGVVRKALNRDAFLKSVFEKTGLRVSVITGKAEGRLTGKGALWALGIQKPPFFVFDLGGGTTEFFCQGKEGRWVNSVSLGAMILTHAFLKSDPPAQKEMEALIKHIDETLDRECPAFAVNGRVIGTGGTVAALCALKNGFSHQDIVPEKINGLALELFEVESWLEKMRCLTTAQRIKRLGLDSGRAGVLVAGSAVVARLLRYLKVSEFRVSMSDLLEGALMAYFEGEQHG